MIETSSGGAGLFAMFKAYGFKVGIGMIGAALLYAVLPPVDKDGKFNTKEFVLRLATAGVFSCFFGDLAIEILQRVCSAFHGLDQIKWSDFKGAVYLMVGAPGWWITRAVALYFHKRKDKDIRELVDEVKG